MSASLQFLSYILCIVVILLDVKAWRITKSLKTRSFMTVAAACCAIMTLLPGTAPWMMMTIAIVGCNWLAGRWLSSQAILCAAALGISIMGPLLLEAGTYTYSWTFGLWLTSLVYLIDTPQAASAVRPG